MGVTTFLVWPRLCALEELLCVEVAVLNDFNELSCSMPVDLIFF